MDIVYKRMVIGLVVRSGSQYAPTFRSMAQQVIVTLQGTYTGVIAPIELAICVLEIASQDYRLEDADIAARRGLIARQYSRNFLWFEFQVSLVRLECRYATHRPKHTESG